MVKELDLFVAVFDDAGGDGWGRGGEASDRTADETETDGGVVVAEAVDKEAKGFVM